MKELSPIPLRSWRMIRILVVLLALAGATAARAFDLTDVSRPAAAIANEPYRDRQTHVPD
jgi:glucan biosynthesis protein